MEVDQDSMGITDNFRDGVVIQSKHRLISNTLEGERTRFGRLLSSLEWCEG